MDMKALKDTLDRINWHYGRGTIRDIQVNQNGAMFAVVHKQYGTETPKISFPRDGFVRFRGKIRKIGYEPRF